MTFTPNRPATGQTLGNSRPEVEGNFTNYFNVISVNHNAPNASGQGKHKFVEMPVQSPVPATLAAEGGLFTQSLSSDPTKSILYYQRDANTTVNQPVLPMACCSFILRDTNLAATQVAGYNVNSVTRTGVGAYIVALGIALPYVQGTTEYMVLYGEIGVPQGGVTLVNTDSITVVGATSTGFTIQLRNISGQAKEDTGNRICFTVIQ